MTKSKKLSIFILSLMLVLASFLFVACNQKDYSKTYLSASSDFVDIYKGDNNSQQITISINNPVAKMSNKILVVNSNAFACKIEELVVVDYSTTYTITGINGGESNISFITEEGNRELEISVKVHEYAQSLDKQSHSLYVSSSKEFIPSSADFDFGKETVTERELEYYFYGKTITSGILSQDVMIDTAEKSNKFTSVSLENIEDEDYLIFNDGNDLYTLGKPTLDVGSGDSKFDFVKVAEEEGEFVLPSNATPVTAGEKFTFVAKYQGESEFLCERDFYVLIDINKDNFSHEFGYKIENVDFVAGEELTSYKIADSKNGGITLIPDYTKVIDDQIMLYGKRAVFSTAYLQVTVDAPNDLLKVDFETEDLTVANSRKIGEKINGDTKTYFYEISCSTFNASKTNYNVSFYYEGFENSDDENVNFTYRVPLEVRIIPTSLLVNNVGGGEEGNVYTFYNSYSSSIVGWQPFNFAVVPVGAEFDRITINLENSDLQLRYRNIVYTSGLVEIANINETVYIKGKDGATVTADVKELPVCLEFDVIKADLMNASIKYRIVKGAEILDFKSTELRENVYLDINGGKQTFNDLYADAEFTTMTFTHIKGTDNVVRFEYDKKEPFKVSGYNFELNFEIVPQMCGYGSYTVMLDNGKMTTINITVLETLNDITIQSTNEDNSITYMEEFVDKEDKSTLIYAVNKEGKSYFDIEVIANSNQNSNAIRNVSPNSSSPIIEIGNASANGQSFKIYLRQNGSSQLELTVDGYSIENFKRIQKQITYYVDIVAYNLIEKMSVYKTQDGFGTYPDKTIASYTDVYSNTSNEISRSASLEVDIKNKNAFLFEKPSDTLNSNEYLAESFDNKFVYWESDTTIYKNGNIVQAMNYVEGETNVYTIGNYGTFNTETFTFTAFENLYTIGSLKLIAHIKQYKNLYSYTVNVRIAIYEEVERVSLQSPVSELEFSTIDRNHYLVAEPTNATATNGEIVAIFNGGVIVVDNVSYRILDENSITYLESDGKTQIKLTVSRDFLEKSINYSDKMQGDLVIVAKDWLDSSGNLKTEYQDLALHITINFANGTLKNRFTISDVDDLYSIKDNLSAHYKISTTIDVSSIVNKLPLGELKGSIVGTNEHACITGLNVTSNTNGDFQLDGGINHFGLFKSIASGAFIEYVQFEGAFNIGSSSAPLSAYSNIGLVAGINYGSLINIGATISSSSIYFNQGSFGGIVGVNEGAIKQDFTLFEPNKSNSRSESVANLAEDGRYSYENLTPKTVVYMNDYVDVNYVVNNASTNVVRIGGVAGLNSGIIEKVDSNIVKTTGYSNYMAYSRIKSTPINLNGLQSISRTYLGGLVGENQIKKSGTNTIGGKIYAGFNTVDLSTGDPQVVFNIYNEYIHNVETEGKIVETGNFEAGKGIVVGGEVWGYGYVGGVVGRSASLSSSRDFAGITSRTFIRGQKAGYTIANIAIIANIESIEGTATLNNAFAIQAVDDGKTAEESSMAILYNGEKVDAYSQNVNKLGFGNFDHLINVLKGFEGDVATEDKPLNVFTYVVSRTQNRPVADGENLEIEYLDKESYYGDYVVVGTAENNTKLVIDQKFFGKGDKNNLSLAENFDNRMIGPAGREIYYAYYYQVASSEMEDLATVQALLDTYLNKITVSSKYYPFIANGEMVFNSRNTDILTIDQMGKITIKKTGLAHVSASSVLNTNDALNFYIYVVNYFNSEYSITDNSQKSSVIYPNLSSSSVAVDKTTIMLRGENSATLYVKPNYSLKQDITIGDNTETFRSDKHGNSIFCGVSFALAGNSDVTVDVKELDALGNVITEDSAKNLDIEVLGQTITIRKLENTQENIYKLLITPRLQLSLENDSIAEGYEVYYVNVNKKLSDTEVDYKYGALYIQNKNYNNVPIFTSDTVLETISVGSTDENEGTPKYYILGLDQLALQGDNSLDYNYQLIGNEQLFNVSFIKKEVKPLGLGRYEHIYDLEIEINTDSYVYRNRYNQNIYGRYMMYIEANSNAGKNLLILIDFEKTNVFSVIVDNYTSLNEATVGNGLGSTSSYAFPGESGFMAITITPEDSDFDYILIENDEQNYQEGNSSANLSILARKSTADGGSEMFEDENISGSVTKKGLKISLNELVDLYAQKGADGKNKYIPYNGVVYVKYNMSTQNVVNGSTSIFNVTLIKDGQTVNNGSAYKELTIRIKNYVALELDGKSGDSTQADYYMVYQVARGLRYKLNINSYGFRLDNASIVSSDTTLGTVVEADGEYYLDITSSTINYPNNVFDLTISVSQTDGEIVRTASSKTKIIVNEYVLNYDGSKIKNADIVTGMGEGIINVQVGSKTTFALDLFDYIEYDETNREVINKINSFFDVMAEKGEWISYTNLLSDDQPNYETAKNDGKTKTYQIGYENGNAQTWNNYYFSSKGLDIIPIRTHLPEEKYYYFTFVGHFEVQNGNYTFVEFPEDGLDHSSQRVETSFVLNVYSSSSEESPMPVYDYDDLMNMQKGGYYILLNDITIPNTYDENGISIFKPIKANFASFDGNGHTINMGGTYNMGSLSNIGLFGTVSEGTVVKNLNLNLTASTDGNDLNTDSFDTTYALYGLRTIKFTTTADSFVYGAIASENLGIITNCKVSTDTVEGSEYYLTIKADNALTGISYIGGLVGANSGFITNSGVSINVKAPFNIGGIVGQNFNKISGCYFKEGRLINNSQFDQHVAGFAINNTQDAQILSSYVAGKQTNTNLYSQDKNSFIASTLASAGFIYENRGNIQDCYTDIDLSQTTSEMAGFVYRNGGIIKNSFSLSVLRNNVTASAGFAKENQADGIAGKFSNCYYFYNRAIETDGFNKQLGDINTSLYNVDHEGVERLNISQFNDLETYFGDYSYQSTIGTNAIWFYSRGNTSNTYVDYVPTTEKIKIEGNDGNTQTNTIYKTEIMTFGLNRLELVNPNIRVLSTRNFSYSDYDQSTGNVTYHYIDDVNSANRGSIHNPYLISNAQNMESEILEQTSATNINISNYRIVSDIIYDGHSNLYKVIFAGNLEGNGMEISRISLVSMDKHESAGMFAQIGYSASKKGTVKNLAIEPKEVSFNNTASVGTVAGTLKYGELYNIKISDVQGTAGTVSGLNFVGGVVGKAVSSYIMKDIYSSASATASYSPTRDEAFVESQNNVANCSYAGSIVGYAGNGSIYNAHVDNVSSVMGSRAGFAYGGLGQGAKVKYTFVHIQPNSSIKAYHYGGYISGEVGGELSHAYVSDNKNIESSFSVIPKTAIAVGGIAGVLNGGKILNALIEQDFRVTTSDGLNSITNVGGIAGLVNGGSTISMIQDCKVAGTIIASNILGGGVGQINSPLIMDRVSIQSPTLSIVGVKADPIVGGIVGYLSGKENSSLVLTNAYCTSRLEITTNTSGVQSVAHAGGLIAVADRAPKLAYCYTTSTITAEVYDSRQTGSIQDFANVGSSEFASNLTFNLTTQPSLNHVYYLGLPNNVSIDGNNADKSIYKTLKDANIVSFATKTKNAKISLAVNNYGTASTDYALSFGLGNIGTNESSLHNLFGNEFKLQENGEISMVYRSTDNSYYVANSASSGVEKGMTFTEDSNNQGIYYCLENIKEDCSNLVSNNNNANFKIEYLAGGYSYTYSKTSNNGQITHLLTSNDINFADLACIGEDMSDEFKTEIAKLKLQKRISFNVMTLMQSKEMIQTKLVMDSSGNYYEYGLVKGEEKYTNIETNISFDQNELNNIPTIEVWNTTAGKLSTLTFENGFNWTSKM